MMSNVQYAILPPADGCSIIVVFGTQEEADAGRIEGGAGDAWDRISKLQEQLDDTGNMCEDYLIESQKFTSISDIPAVKKIVESFGFVENTKLAAAGWS